MNHWYEFLLTSLKGRADYNSFHFWMHQLITGKRVEKILFLEGQGASGII